MTNRDEPVGLTCTTIDRIVTRLLEARMRTNEDGKYEIDAALVDLEDVRSDNAALREWGNNLVDDLEYLEDQINDKDKELGEIRDRVLRAIENELE